MSSDTFKEGLEAAAKFLEGTAADYDQSADMVYRTAFAGPTPHEKTQAAAMREKALLLRGQAQHIKELRP